MPSVYALAWCRWEGQVYTLIGRKCTCNMKPVSGEGFIHNNAGAWCIPGGGGSGESHAALELVEETGLDSCMSLGVSAWHGTGFTVFAYEFEAEQAWSYDYQTVRQHGEMEARQKHPDLGLWCSEFEEARFVLLSEAEDLIRRGAVLWSEADREEYIRLLPSCDVSRRRKHDQTAQRVLQWQADIQQGRRDAVVEKLNLHLSRMKNDWFLSAISAFRDHEFKAYGKRMQARPDIQQQASSEGPEKPPAAQPSDDYQSHASDDRTSSAVGDQRREEPAAAPRKYVPPHLRSCERGEEPQRRDRSREEPAAARRKCVSPHLRSCERDEDPRRRDREDHQDHQPDDPRGPLSDQRREEPAAARRKWVPPHLRSCERDEEPRRRDRERSCERGEEPWRRDRDDRQEHEPDNPRGPLSDQRREEPAAARRKWVPPHLRSCERDEEPWRRDRDDRQEHEPDDPRGPLSDQRREKPAAARRKYAPPYLRAYQRDEVSRRCGRDDPQGHAPNDRSVNDLSGALGDPRSSHKKGGC